MSWPMMLRLRHRMQDTIDSHGVLRSLWISFCWLTFYYPRLILFRFCARRGWLRNEPNQLIRFRDWPGLWRNR